MSAVIQHRLPLRPALFAFLILAAGAVLALLLTPHILSADSKVDLESVVPAEFGDWKLVPGSAGQVALSSDAADALIRELYDQTVMRTYVNSQGEAVMLALAWGRRQRQEFKVHRPEVCYAAQGFQVQGLEASTFRSAQGDSIRAYRMLAVEPRRTEAVRYWIRLGNRYIDNGWQARAYIVREGLQGRVPDGILVRASQVVHGADGAAESWPVLDRFLSDLLSAAPADTRSLLVVDSASSPES